MLNIFLHSPCSFLCIFLHLYSRCFSLRVLMLSFILAALVSFFMLNLAAIPGHFALFFLNVFFIPWYAKQSGVVVSHYAIVRCSIKSVIFNPILACRVVTLMTYLWFFFMITSKLHFWLIQTELVSPFILLPLKTTEFDKLWC